jgi:hypothetical protein
MGRGAVFGGGRKLICHLIAPMPLASESPAFPLFVPRPVGDSASVEVMLIRLHEFGDLNTFAIAIPSPDMGRKKFGPAYRALDFSNRLNFPDVALPSYLVGNRASSSSFVKSCLSCPLLSNILTP